METTTHNEVTTAIVNFLQEIGIPVVFRTLEEETVLPGITIENEGLVVDKEKLLYPGDLLHEGGHIAVAPPSYRKTLSGRIDPQEDFKHAGELMTLAWSYAAAVHLGIDPHIVFHPAGYHGQADQLVYSFGTGSTLGVPGLQWAQMTAMGDTAAALGVPPFPHMTQWVREHEPPKVEETA